MVGWPTWPRVPRAWPLDRGLARGHGRSVPRSARRRRCQPVAQPHAPAPARSRTAGSDRCRRVAALASRRQDIPARPSSLPARRRRDRAGGYAGPRARRPGRAVSGTAGARRRGPRPGADPRADRRRRWDHHGRPQARSGISAADHGHPRAARRPSSIRSSRSSAICIAPTASTPASTRSAWSSTRTTWTTPSIAAGW